MRDVSDRMGEPTDIGQVSHFSIFETPFLGCKMINAEKVIVSSFSFELHLSHIHSVL
jgi:hypothetical protein